MRLRFGGATGEEHHHAADGEKRRAGESAQYMRVNARSGLHRIYQDRGFPGVLPAKSSWERGNGAHALRGEHDSVVFLFIEIECSTASGGWRFRVSAAQLPPGLMRNAFSVSL